MKEYKLSDLLKIKNGKDHKFLPNGKYPVFGSGGIMRYVNQYLYDKPSILLPRKGSLSGIQYYDKSFWTVDTLFYSEVNEELVSPYYLYLYLTLLNLEGLDTGTGVPSMTSSSYYNIKVKLPNLEEQKRKASYIRRIDTKIALNRQINDNLEALARQLYDYWFVQFDFPDDNGKPYKSSGGKMVWNEKLKREIPYKWSDCTLQNYIGRITNGLNPRKNFVLGNGNNYYVTIRSLAGTTINWNNCDRCDDEALSKINARSQLQVGDIIFSAIGTIGRTYYILDKPLNWNISETSFTIRAKEEVPTDFFYSLLRSKEIQAKADNAAMGSTLRCIVMKSFCDLVCCKVPADMMNRFAAIVSPIYLEIHKINKQIAGLTKQRDELLPLLMNGQVTANVDKKALIVK